MRLTGLNLSEREKTVLLTGLLLVLVVAFYLYMYQPTMIQVDLMKIQLEDLQARLVEVRKIKADPVVYNAQMESNKAQARAIEAKLPTGEGATEFVRQTEERVLNNKLKLVSFKPDKMTDKGQYLVYPYILEVRGQYDNVIKFLKALETMPRLVNVTGWKLSKNESGLITATYFLETYGAKGKEQFSTTPFSNTGRDGNPFI